MIRPKLVSPRGFEAICWVDPKFFAVPRETSNHGGLQLLGSSCYYKGVNVQNLIGFFVLENLKPPWASAFDEALHPRKGRGLSNAHPVPWDQSQKEGKLEIIFYQ